MLNKKIFYILPCYNEELNLNKLLNDFNNFFKNKDFSIQIIIVDDGSKDNSLRVIKKFKKNKYSKKIKITVLKHKKNLGLGDSLKDGFNYCTSRGGKNDLIISMDCDNSHTVELSYKMAMKIIKNNFDIVIASRYKKNSRIKGLAKNRIFLSYMAAFLYKFFFPIQNVKDYTSGFRAFRLNIIKKACKNNKKFFSEKGFSASADIILKLFKYKDQIKFEEVPINLRYDLKFGQSKMKIVKTIFLNLKLIMIRRLFN
tara:strand:+ start:25 stop:792 length:768 start_codon:yes stop_codon:yes gene_type:complete